jgi:hypothetical protein
MVEMVAMEPQVDKVELVEMVVVVLLDIPMVVLQWCPLFLVVVMGLPR